MNEKITGLFLSCILLFTPVLSGCKSVQPDNTNFTDSVEFISGEISAIISEIDASTERARDNIRDTIETAEDTSGELQFLIDCLQRYESEVSALLEAYSRTRSELESLKESLPDINSNTKPDDSTIHTNKNNNHLPED